MKTQRTRIDFSKHELSITKTDEVVKYYFKKPGTVCYSVMFINTCGIMAVTGDMGNWMFCREFHPSAKNYVSDEYWCEKLRISSTQVSHNYDSEKTVARINEMLNGGLEDYGYEGERLEEGKKYLRKCLKETDYEWGYTAYAYQNYPDGWDSEQVIFEKSIDHSLLGVFDAFDEICKRVKIQEEAA